MRNINEYAGLMIANNFDENINKLVKEMLTNETVSINTSEKSVWIYRPFEKIVNDRKVLVLGSTHTKDKDFIRIPLIKAKEMLSGIEAVTHYNKRLKKWTVKIVTKLVKKS